MSEITESTPESGLEASREASREAATDMATEVSREAATEAATDTAKVLPLLVAPDPLLRKRSEPVAAVDDAVRQLMHNLVKTMHAEGGIGLAAPQAGIHRRVIVVDVEAEDGGTGYPLRLANPELKQVSADKVGHSEGCLSVPELTAEIFRSAEVTVAYLDESGTAQEITASGLFAACLQHEIDHLNGVLFFDHLGAVRREMIIRRLKKRKRELEGKSESSAGTGGKESARAGAPLL